MTIIAKPTGLDTQGKLLYEILRQLDTLGKIFSNTPSPVGDSSVLILTNETTGIKTRFIATDTGYRIDITLTPLGFDGVESLDNGVTGDWVTTASA